MPYIGDLLGVRALAADRRRRRSASGPTSPTRSPTGGARAPPRCWSSSRATSPAGRREPSSSSSGSPPRSTSTTSGSHDAATAGVRDAPTAGARRQRRSSGHAAPPTCGTSTTGAAGHNIPNVGLFLWRLQAYPLVDVDAAGGRRPAVRVRPARPRPTAVRRAGVRDRCRLAVWSRPRAPSDHPHGAAPAHRRRRRCRRRRRPARHRDLLMRSVRQWSGLGAPGADRQGRRRPGARATRVRRPRLPER